ncbi:SpoIID/LytB domain-containing protein [candidate division WWE3 bacterium]|uniref:SpoIID/LytB domain-containing protein n=1 Tax=candidate division WWE3 bacterium TaxID=2053526 RepID=A0A955LHE7_UNCKA|nr:SpoIID/LytB domain-containing protein [candidate division WWE3 bacterium]
MLQGKSNRTTILMLGIISIGLLFFGLTPRATLGDELDDLEQQLQNTRNEIAQTQSKLDKTKQDLESAKQQEAYYTSALNTLSGQLEYAQWQLEQTKLELEQKRLEIQQTQSQIDESRINAEYQSKLLKQVVRKFYMTSFVDDVAVFLQESDNPSLGQLLTYRHAVAKSYRERLAMIVEQLNGLEAREADLENTKKELEDAQTSLNSQQQTLEWQIASTQSQISSSQSKQSQLTTSLTGIKNQLSSLTQKEKEILQAKAAAALASTTVGEGVSATIYIDPPATGTYFSFLTYGHPHQVGMNQYGAYGRSIAGQDYKTILKAYFSNVKIEQFFDDNDKIPVQGYGNISMRDYLYGIGEMPESWGDAGGYEALKAQVIASRTYALNYIYYSWNGSDLVEKSPVSICTDQNCQVYTGGKKTGKWKQAVDETDGEVITYNGKPITAWYSTTAGGFTLSAQEAWGGYRPWALAVNDLDSLSFPYDGEKYANSPLYHVAYGSQPWLSPEQVTDLFNASLLPTQYDNNLPASEFSPEDVQNTLQSNGITPVDTISGVEVTGYNSRSSSLVRVYYGNNQSREVDAQRFRFVFNLRSPGTDLIPTARFDVTRSN